MKFRRLFRRDTVGKDAVSGLVLGVESVPDSLASGLLAGVNPIYGLYGAMWGTFTGALFTSSAFMAVQTTGAMSIIVSDVDEIANADDPAKALFTLSIMTGLVMLMLGLAKLGMLLNYVSQSVMIGFISAVGVNIVLGQLDGFTGYEAEGSNRISRALDLLTHIGDIDPKTFTTGAATIVLILVLERTKLGALGMVVAVFAASAMVPLFGWEVENLKDLADIPNSLPLPKFPDLGLIPSLLVPAAALAFIGLVQGAGVSASFPRPDGTPADASQDFIGQGAANIAAGALQGMPVGGSMSASALAVSGGAKSRLAVVIAGVVMAVVILLFAGPVGYIAMPALSGLLITVGVRTIKPGQIGTVLRTGRIQQMVLMVTFVLTMLIPLQFAVLIGVGTSMILYVIRQSTQISLQRLRIDDEGHVIDAGVPQDVRARSCPGTRTGWQPLLRRRAGIRRNAPRSKRRFRQLGGHPASPRPRRRRRDPDRGVAPVCAVAARCGEQTGPRLGAAGRRAAAAHHRCDRCDRRGEHLRAWTLADRHTPPGSLRCCCMDRRQSGWPERKGQR